MGIKNSLNSVNVVYGCPQEKLGLILLVFIRASEYNFAYKKFYPLTQKLTHSRTFEKVGFMV